VLQYEPELFPGLIYRMVQPKIVLLIFVSGKIVLTGAKVTLTPQFYSRHLFRYSTLWIKKSIVTEDTHRCEKTSMKHLKTFIQCSLNSERHSMQRMNRHSSQYSTSKPVQYIAYYLSYSTIYRVLVHTVREIIYPYPSIHLSLHMYPVSLVFHKVTEQCGWHCYYYYCYSIFKLQKEQK
jgi:hypothetical protein